jgi:DNA-binding transcriptional ArsR family regulator
MRRSGHSVSTLDMQTAALQRMAEAFADLGNATRLCLLLRLAAGPKTVSELTAEADVKQPTVSSHLDQLHAAGWLNRVWESRHVRYSLHDNAVRQLVGLSRSSPASLAGGLRRSPAEPEGEHVARDQ